MLRGKAKTGGGDYEMVPQGNHPGVLIALIDLGTHYESFQGQGEKKTRKVMFVWEVEAEVDGKDKRLVIGRDFNVYTNDKGEVIYGQKSNIRKLLEGWRGKAYGEDEDIDLEAVWKKPCLVSVKHDKTNRGKDVSKVDNVSALPKGMAALKPSFECLTYSADSDDAVPSAEWLPRMYGEKLADVIGRSLEHNGSGRREGGNGQPAAAGASTAEQAEQVF